MRKPIGITVICISVLALLIASCGTRGPQPAKTLTDNDVLVRIDEKPLTFSDFKDYCTIVAGTPVERITSGKERSRQMTSMLNDTLFGGEAAARGLDNTDAYRAKMRLYESKILPPLYVEKEISGRVEVTGKDFKKYIFPQPLRIQLQAYVSDNEARTYEALRRAQAGEDYGAIIKASSEGITRNRGGDIGYVAIGTEDLFQKSEQEYFRTLNKGEFSKVFKSRIGYMVVRVTDILTPEDQSKRTAESLKDRIKLEKEREAYDELVARLRKLHKARLDGRNLGRIGSGKTGGMKPPEVQTIPIAWIGKEPVPYASLLAFGAPTFHSANDLALMADKHLNEILVSREARKLGLDVDPSATRQLKWFSRNTLARLLIEEISRGVKAEEADYRAYYDTHQAEFKIPELVRLSVVEVRNEKRAAEALAMLGKGTPFAEVVGKLSDDVELKKSGGDIGYIPVEKLLDEMKALTPKMKEGDTSPAVKVTTPKERYLVFRLTGRQPAGVADYAKIRREVISPRIVAQKRESAIKGFMEEAGKKHKVDWVKSSVDAILKTGTDDTGEKGVGK
jgi:parvulin-like peptidyl-prolyl isomerase